MATTTNYGWTTPDDTALVKDGASAIRTLGTSVDTTTKNLNPETTLGDISFRSSTSNVNTRIGIGTSGQSLTVVAGAPSWAASPTSVLTTTGDSLYASAANTLARLGIGTTGQVLTVASGIPSWATPAAGGGITLISETVASGLSSLSFSSIPGTYKHLVLVWNGVYNSNGTTGFGVRLNNDSTASIYKGYINGVTAGLSQISSADMTNAASVNGYIMGMNTSSSISHENAQGSLTIFNYASASKLKQYEGKFSFYRSSDYPGAFYYDFNATYNSASAVTSIDIVQLLGSGTFSNNTNTSIRLYGVA